MRAIGATSAWDVTRGHESITIGIVDSGSTAAPDLEGQFVPGYDFVSNPTIAADGGGRDDDPTDPGDQVAGGGTSSWHGTHIAALLAGRHDGPGVAGLVPDCRLMMLRALGIGGGYVSDAADAILYAAGQLALPDGSRLSSPLRLLNLSIGLAQDSTELREACARADNVGVLLIAAVGNGGGRIDYPARYDSTFAVAAVDGQLLTTQYSAFGSAVDIAAPGGGPGTDAGNDGWPDGVLSAVKDETVEPAIYSHGYLIGTSQAVPHVVGTAAMLLAINPALTSLDIETILRGSALDLGVPGDDIAYGSGLVQAHEAVKIALNMVGNPRADGPQLLVPRTTVQFDGLRSSIDVPLLNGGSGTMNVFFATPFTADGAPWLAAELDPVMTPAPPVNNSRVTITVDRSMLPATPGRYSGLVTLGNSSGTHATIRVVAYVQQRTRAGQLLPVVALDAETGIARRKGFAYPETGYRFWLRNLPASTYRLPAGEDLDFDVF
ncbi:MAG: S8 family serine peptidase, partial [Planctomycetota bacterium]|nr:S8 family serine peptidase [Planctomycetota bacterium]